MLERLTVENYALIDKLELTPGEGLSIITGETGAGKSIMLGALSLLLGERADTRVIADKERKSIVEASFCDIDKDTACAVREVDPEWDATSLIVRREILPTGRSRTFLNDSPIKLTDLSSITRRLVDIHSQHSNAMLSMPEQQLRLVDIMAFNEDLLVDYRSTFRSYVELRQRIKHMRALNEQTRANREMYEFQLAQLDKLNPKPGELETVERRFDILSDSEDIKSYLSEAAYLLGGGDEGGALGRVDSALASLRQVDLSLFENLSEGEPGLVSRMQQIRIELKDILESVESIEADIDGDPAELAKVTARMNRLYEANRQFKISETDGLVKLREELRSKLVAMNSESDISEMETRLRSLAHTLKEKADRLTESRRKAASDFARKLEDTARPLGLPNIRFEVEMTTGKLTRDGQDIVEFFCSFNKNMPMSAMTKVASGGEIARVMLCIKEIVAGTTHQPTVIFDEIDTGVSGEIADKMGKMMRDMGRNMQVLTITHLPQVAAKGERHFKVFKHDRSDRTVSEVRQLSAEERVAEIAGMLSGEVLNEAAFDAAKVLLANT